MFPLFLLAIFSGTKLINTVVGNNNTCVPSIYQYDRCHPTLSTKFDCSSSTWNLVENRNISSCSSVEIFWSYPMNNLTIIIQTIWTEKHRPYTIHLQAKNLKPQILHLYRIEQGVEKQVKIRGKVIKQKSDENYQIILKFQAPKILQFYGVFIRYSVIKN